MLMSCAWSCHGKNPSSYKNLTECWGWKFPTVDVCDVLLAYLWYVGLASMGVTTHPSLTAGTRFIVKSLSKRRQVRNARMKIPPKQRANSPIWLADCIGVVKFTHMKLCKIIIAIAMVEKLNTLIRYKIRHNYIYCKYVILHKSNSAAFRMRTG